MILTKANRYQNAIRFKENNSENCWLVLGQTSEWEDEFNPPSPTEETTEVPEAFCAIRATVKWVVEDEDGDLDYVDPTGTHHKFAEIQTKDDVYDDLFPISPPVYPIVHLYGEATGAQINVVSYRACGFVTDLVPTAGNEDADFLLAGQVADWGRLETLEYKKLRTVQPAGSYSVAQLIDY